MAPHEYCGGATTLRAMAGEEDKPPPINIGFDFDDTIAQTVQALIQRMRRDKEFKYPKIRDLRFENMINFRPDDMVGMPKEEFCRDIIAPCIYREDSNWSHIFPFQGAIKGLVQVNRAITFPNGITIVSQRRRNSDIFDWLRTWFSWYSLTVFFPLFSIWVGKTEGEKCVLLSKLKFDFFVDDKVGITEHLMNNTRTYPIIFDRPWNRAMDSEEHPGKAFKRLVPIRAVGWDNLIHILLYLKNKRELWTNLHRIMDERLLTSWLELQKSGSKSSRQ